jgi:membrane-anchored mycosin MYCP
VVGVRRILAMAAALTLVLLSAAPAQAVTPPSIDPEAVPADTTGPELPLEQRRYCSEPTTLPDSEFRDAPWANDYLNISAAHRFATGGGVTVAVIDTGVNPSPRVPAEAGGDFIDEAGDGLTDCDSHGTITASIIAGRGAPTDAFIGVAPDARLISLRQTSEAYEPVGLQVDPRDPNSTPAAASIRSLARAIVHAANLDAGVINISEAACFKVTRPVDQSSLGGALNYAVNVKGAVVVVAAGNTGGDCNQNPPMDPSGPADPRGWQDVQTIVTPAWYDSLVLTVGGVAPTGASSPFSMQGPWVGAAAPAEDIIGLGGDGKPVNALQGEDGPVPIAGTSFAAAYVSGVAALVRQRFPELTPAEVIDRIVSTARHPGGGVDNAVGAGPVDAHDALTWEVPTVPQEAPPTVIALPPPVVVPPPDRGPITTVAAAVAGLGLALALVALVGRALKRR